MEMSTNAKRFYDELYALNSDTVQGSFSAFLETIEFVSFETEFSKSQKWEESITFKLLYDGLDHNHLLFKNIFPIWLNFLSSK